MSKTSKTVNSFNRRSFLKGGASALSFAALQGTFQTMMAPRAMAANDPVASPYGPVAPARDRATGLNLIQLPRDFTYTSYGWTGDPTSAKYGSIPTPSLHDGMGIIKVAGESIVLVRNHEQSGGTAFPTVSNFRYSPASSGGTTNVWFDQNAGEFTRSYPTLSGTWRNCAGGVTPWNSWLTCEEVGPTQTTAGGAFKHGYVFEVDISTGMGPYREMGRFSHEAATVDPVTGYVYMTEDGPSASGDVGSGFYRFIPVQNGCLAKGGKLQMMKLAHTNRFNTGGLSYGAPIMDVEWVDVPNPDPNVPSQPSCFQQGFMNGAASFERLEGCFCVERKIVFLSTSGGPATEGQIFSYDLTNETLEVVFVSTAQSILENPDNLTVAPDGSILLCEDNAGNTTNAGERLLFVTPGRQIFEFAMNNLDFRVGQLGPYTRPESGITFTGNQRQNEWAGACFSPDGKWLFVNNQTPGITFAITGPWAWT